jgi:hypothetical protein
MSFPSQFPVIQYNSDQAHKYLGNYMAPNFQMKTAFSHLLAASNHFARRLAASPLSRRDAWIAYFAVYVPAMTYTFPVTTHSVRSLRTQQSKALRAILNKLGYNCNTPLVVVFGPIVNLGLSLRDLPTEQGIALLVMLLRHIRSHSDQDRLLFITLAWWQLLMGTSYPLLERPQDPLPYDTAHVLSAARQSLKTVHSSVHIPTLYLTLPVPFWENDQCLTEVFSTLPSTTRAKLETANIIRIFYGVAYLSELTTADGKFIAHDAWEGHRSRISPLLWPFQPSPGPKTFRVWRRLLTAAFLRGPHLPVSVRTRDLQLRTAVGRWLPTSSAFRYHWDAIYAPSTTSRYLVSASGTSFDIHVSKKARRRPRNPVWAFSDTPTDHVPLLPPDAVRADYAIKPNKLVIPPSLTWADYASSLPPWEQFLCRHVIILERALLFDCLRHSGHLFLASDGSAADCKGSYGCVLASEDIVLLTCGGRAEGSDPKSFRVEDYGMLAI